MTGELKQEYKQPTLATQAALEHFNRDYNKNWDMATNWSNVQTDFETFINKYLFPKINETLLIDIALGNRFNWLAKEQQFIGQYSEEYVIMDTVPVAMNLGKNEELMLKRNYPHMATRLYGSGIVKKQKFTLNNNDNRFNWQNLGDATSYALAVLRKKISDINVEEEKEIRAMLLDYSQNQLSKDNIRRVTSEEDLTEEVFEAILNMQNNSDKYNEAQQASGGAIGRYTTVSQLSDIAILTTDRIKSYLLNTKIANAFQANGLDFSNRIISFDDLSGVYQTTEEIKLENRDTIEYLRSFGDYQAEIGDVIPEGSTFTFDITRIKEFEYKYKEIKPVDDEGEPTDLYAFVFDVNGLKYKRSTDGMLKEPFYNPELDEVTYWLHYYSFKAVSPFFNKILIKG